MKVQGPTVTVMTASTEHILHGDVFNICHSARVRCERQVGHGRVEHNVPQVSFQGDTQHVVFLILVIACVSWRYVWFSSDACESHRSGAVAVVMAVGRPHVRSRFRESIGGGEGCALAVPSGENEHFVVLFQWSDCVASRDVPSRFVSDARSDVGWVEVGWTGPLGGALRFSPLCAPFLRQ